jgi:hypothetical protein
MSSPKLSWKLKGAFSQSWVGGRDVVAPLPVPSSHLFLSPNLWVSHPAGISGLRPGCISQAGGYVGTGWEKR